MRNLSALSLTAPPVIPSAFCHFEPVERSSSARLLPKGRKKSPNLSMRFA